MGLEAALEDHGWADPAAGFIPEDHYGLQCGTPAWFSTGIERLADRDDPVGSGLHGEMLNQFAERLLPHPVHRGKIRLSRRDGNGQVR